jgi:hypothetical protein
MTMLDDRLTSAGLALREAPVPDVTPTDLRHRQAMRRTRRTAFAVAALLAALVGSARLLEPDHRPVQVIDHGQDEIHVPHPITPDQLLPRRMPEGWTLTSWSEVAGGIAGNPMIWVYGNGGPDFAAHPYVALLEMDHAHASVAPLQPTDETVLVHGAPARIGTADGLRHVNFQLGTHVLTAVGAQVDDESLRRFAEGIVVEDPTVAGGVRASWLPDGVEVMREHALGNPGSRGSRTFTWTGPSAATFSFTTNVDTQDVSLEQLLWQRPGADAVRVDGTYYGRLRDGDTTTLWWVAGQHVGASVRATGIADDDLYAMLGDLVERRPDDIAELVRSVPTDSPVVGPGRRQVSPSVITFDDVVEGHREIGTAFLTTDPQGVGLCDFHGGGGGCGAAKGQQPRDGKALEVSGWSDGWVTFALRDDVVTYAVAYRGRPTRVYPVVRPFEGYMAIGGVSEPEGAEVLWVEARAADGTVLGRYDGPLPST